MHVLGLQLRLRERLGDEPVQDCEARRRIKIGVHGLGALGQRRARQVREQDLDVMHTDIRAQDDGALAAETIPARRAPAGRARDRIERCDPTQLAKVGQGGVDTGAR